MANGIPKVQPVVSNRTRFKNIGADAEQIAKYLNELELQGEDVSDEKDAAWLLVYFGHNRFEAMCR